MCGGGKQQSDEGEVWGTGGELVDNRPIAFLEKSKQTVSVRLAALRQLFFLVVSSWLYIELISKTNYSSICSENRDSRFRKLV